MNPYHVGFTIFKDIEKRYSHMTAAEFAEKGESPKSARDKMFEVREVERDSSFLRRFLSEKLIREMDLFRYQPDQDQNIVVTDVADEESWQNVKDTLITNCGMGRIPVIKVVDGDFGDNRNLLLSHTYDGRELQLEYAERTMHYVQRLWGRKVFLDTQANGEKLRLTYDGDGTFTKIKVT